MRLARVIFVSLTLAAALRADPFDLGGHVVDVPAPEGFLRVDESMPGFARLFSTEVDPMNDLLAVYVPEDVAAAGRKGETPDLKRYFMLKVNKQLRGRDISAEDYSAIKEVMREQSRQGFAKAVELARDAVAKTAEKLSDEYQAEIALAAAPVATLPVHADEEDYLSFSMLVRYEETRDGRKTGSVTANTAGFSVLRQRLLFFYSFGLREDLAWTREANRKWVRAGIDAAGGGS